MDHTGKQLILFYNADFLTVPKKLRKNVSYTIVLKHSFTKSSEFKVIGEFSSSLSLSF